MTKIQPGDTVVFRRKLNCTKMLVIDVYKQLDEIESTTNNHQIVCVVFWFRKIEKYCTIRLNEDEFCLRRR